MQYDVKKEDRFEYIETNPEQPATLLLLHGLFGALSNFNDIIQHFGDRYNVVVPLLPLYKDPIPKVTVTGFVNYVEQFVELKQYEQVHLLGNSLGGHIALLYTLRKPERVATMTLTGSSGLFESGLGSTFPRRGDYEFIKTRTEQTFYDPKVATKELVDEVFDIVNDRGKAIRVVATAKSALRHNVGDQLDQITIPVLLIWGQQDIITPPFVGEKFHELLPNSELHLVEKCGHAPMMEHPQTFNQLLDQFLSKQAAANA